MKYGRWFGALAATYLVISWGSDGQIPNLFDVLFPSPDGRKAFGISDLLNIIVIAAAGLYYAYDYIRDRA